MDSLAERIQKRLKVVGLSPRGASIKAGLGPDGIRNILRGRTESPRGKTLTALADILQCDIEYLTGESDTTKRNGRIMQEYVDFSEKSSHESIMPQGAPPLPIYQFSEYDSETNVLQRRQIGTTSRVSALTDVPDAYAVYVPNQSMYPRLNVGDLLQVHPYQPPSVGDLVLIILQGESPRAFVAEYRGPVEDSVEYKLYNRETHSRIGKKEVSAVHRVAGIQLS